MGFGRRRLFLLIGMIFGDWFRRFFFSLQKIEVSWVPIGQDANCHLPNLTWVIFWKSFESSFGEPPGGFFHRFGVAMVGSSDSNFLFEKGEVPLQDTRRKEWTSPSLTVLCLVPAEIQGDLILRSVFQRPCLLMVLVASFNASFKRF